MMIEQYDKCFSDLLCKHGAMKNIYVVDRHLNGWTVWQCISITQDPNYGDARYCAVIYYGATNQLCKEITIIRK